MTPAEPFLSGTDKRSAHASDGGDVASSPPISQMGRRAPHRAVLTGAGIAALTAAMLRMSHPIDLNNVLLVYLLAVVVAAMITARTLALAAAVVCWLLANFLFNPPHHALSFDEDHLVELAVLVVVSMLVSLVVDAGARHREAAYLHQRELQLLSDLAAVNTHEVPAIAVLSQVRAVLGMRWVRLVRADDGASEAAVAQLGDPDTAPRDFSVEAGNGLRIEGASEGRVLVQSERVRRAIADGVAHLWNEQDVADQLARARRTAETARLREKVLAAVSHDLRTPLASIKAHASALRQPDIAWPDDVRSELLASIEETADQLTDIVTNLLAITRLRRGVLRARVSEVLLYEVVGRALTASGDHATVVEVPDHLPPVLADEALLERIVANLVTNAHQHGGAVQPVTVRAETTPGGVRLAVVDHGPGIERERWDEVFKPFQRLEDGGAGLGLGLAIVKGFSDAMGIAVSPSQTAGGGLTMTLTLSSAR